MNAREIHESLATDISLFSKLTPILVHSSTVALTTHRGHTPFCDFSQKHQVSTVLTLWYYVY